MRIKRLYVRDVKRLRVVEIRPKDNTVIIGGKNGEGKTSVIDSIAMALAGKKAIPGEPVRRGQRKAEIIVEIGDLVVTRKFTKRDSYLEVTTKDGVPKKSPQKILDELVGTAAGFDPLAFIRQPPKAQLDIMKELAGLDFTDLDERRATAYAERKFFNREAKDQQVNLDAMEIPERPDADGPVKLVELSKELKRRQQVNHENREARNELEEQRGAIQRIVKRKQEAEEELRKAAETLTTLTQEHRAAERKIAALVDEDEAATTHQISTAEQINEAFQVIDRAQTKRQAVIDAEASADEKTAVIEACDRERADQVAAAKMPIDGLGLGDDCITLDDLPFDQASSAEQLRTAVAIALKMTGELKVVLIRDGSLLDDNSLALVSGMADAADAQVWVEQVDPDDPTAVILKDGMIAGETSESE